MALETHIRKAVAIGIIGLASLAINPNFEARDLGKPYNFIQKSDYNRGYEGSGKVYLISAGLLYGAAVGGLYKLVTGGKNK